MSMAFALFGRMSADQSQPERVFDRLNFDEAELTISLDRIAEPLLIYSADTAAREPLPSWVMPLALSDRNKRQET